VVAQPWTFGKKIALGFGLSVTMLLVVGTVAYRSDDALVKNNHKVTHSHEVLEAVAHELSFMKDAETGQRGFLLTGNEAYVEPYQSALDASERTMVDLRTLTADNPRQQASVTEARSLIVAKLDELKRSNDVRRAQALDAALKVVETGEGKKSMDDLPKQEERDLLKERSDDAEAGARKGGQTLSLAQEAIEGIKRQVDLVVGHMLELGKKSQRAGSILEIVNELAEQTNILAINASIEAAGAGDSGKRFSVVADEIRKLADRVGGSTKEIRALIDDIRASVNTTVMATEAGTKAVDAGTRQFSDVAASFKQIADLVGTTTEAAKEIELSTKQQVTAVEQVNVAISNVAQATKETETSSNQTLQTATQLSGLSSELIQLAKQNAA
jgi:methyl-accepting chemotaxis protein